MKDFHKKKYLIRQILRLHELTILEGGLYELSDTYLSLISKMKELLDFAGLAYSEENIRQVFDYPFNPSFDLKDICSVTICARKEAKVREKYIKDILEKSVLVWKYEPFSMDLKVMNVKTNLMGMREDWDGL